MQKLVKPFLLVKEIADVYTRKNFQALVDYFREENQLLDFKFFELSFGKEQKSFVMNHNLGYVPQDIIVTKIVGAGVVRWKRSLSTSSTITLEITGPCIFRFYLGTYFNVPGTKAPFDEVSEFKGTLETTQTLFPTGAIIGFGGLLTSKDWLLCDGKSYKNSDYPALAKFLNNAYGAGDSSDSFNVPMGCGYFMRGVDNGKGNDPDASSRFALFSGGSEGDKVGSYQRDALQGHWHQAFGAGIASGNGYNLGGVSASNVNLSGVRDPITDGVNGAPRVSSETRAKNFSVYFYIKT